MAAIRRFARQIAERFHPEKIILFGSYAYGTPHNESDVDLLVIMPARNATDQALRIALAFEEFPFCLDLIVRTPKQIAIGFRDDNWFLREIVEKGKVLYESANGGMGAESGGGRRRGARHVRARATAAESGGLSQSTGGREVPQIAASRIRRSRTKDPLS